MFSHYDEIASPIMIYSADLEPLYANDVAVRSYPLLAGGSLQLYFLPATREKIRKDLKKGLPVQVPVDSDFPIDVLFDPCSDATGKISHVKIYVCNPEDYDEALLVYNQTELLRVLHRDLVSPVHNAFTALDAVEDDPDLRKNLRLGQAFRRARKYLMAAARCLVRIDDTETLAAKKIFVCNADAALQLCENVFPAMRYESEGIFYLPVGRDAFIQIITDVLAALSLRQTSGSKIHVCANRLERRWEVLFRAGNLVEKPEVASSVEDMFSSYCKVTSCGGEVKVRFEGRSTVNISLIFPDVRFSAVDVSVGDYVQDEVAVATAMALEYLRELSEGFEL